MTTDFSERANPVALVDKSLVESQEPKSHARLLTMAEWAEVVPPFYYIRVNFPEWGSLEWQIAEKWIISNCQSWAYVDQPRIVFGSEDDFVLFRLWAEEKPMKKTDTLEVT
jgi:hypothetical protein